MESKDKHADELTPAAKRAIGIHLTRLLSLALGVLGLANAGAWYLLWDTAIGRAESKADTTGRKAAEDWIAGARSRLDADSERLQSVVSEQTNFLKKLQEEQFVASKKMIGDQAFLDRQLITLSARADEQHERLEGEVEEKILTVVELLDEVTAHATDLAGPELLERLHLLKTLASQLAESDPLAHLARVESITIQHRDLIADLARRLSATAMEIEAKDSLPSGTIIAWLPSVEILADDRIDASEVPKGWRIPSQLNGRFLRGTTEVSAIMQPGGSEAHSHTGKTAGESKRFGAEPGKEQVADIHSHTLETTEDAHIPPYLNVIFLEKL